MTIPVRLPLTRTEQVRDVELKMPWNVVELSFADGSSFEASALHGADGVYEL